MEAYSSSSSSSSSTSPMYLQRYPQEGKSLKHSQSLHSVRKPQVKPWKKPIAPLPPVPPRVYKVDPVNFKDLVQKLTGSPDSIEQSPPPPPPQQRLQRVAPPPLDLDKQTALFSRDSAAGDLRYSPVKASFAGLYQELMSDTDDPKRIAPSSMELNLLSSSTHAWCSIPLLSPGTLSSLEQHSSLIFNQG